MNIVYTTIFGSRLHGTETPQSDTDWKSVYLPELKSLLRGHRIKNSVKTTGITNEKNGADDEDHEHIPLQVLAEDFLKGQIYALEVVFSVLNPEHVKSSLYDERFVVFCQELSKKFLTRDIHAMMGYAHGQSEKYGIKGSRLNSLRAFHEVVERFSPNNSEQKIGENLEFLAEVEAVSDKYLFRTLYDGFTTDRGEAPKDPAISLLGKIFPFEINFAEASHRTNRMLAGYGNRSVSAAKADGKDWKALSHALRITWQAYDVLTLQQLKFPFEKDRRDYLVEVKLGQRPFDEVRNILANTLQAVDGALERTTLPVADPQLTDDFYAWLDEWLYVLYDLT